MPAYPNRGSYFRLPAVMAAAVVLSAFSTTFGGAVRADEEKGRFISTSGEAMVSVVPDEAVFTFGVETTNNNLDAVQAESEKTSAKLIKAVTDLGVEAKNVSTDRLHLEVLYDNRRDGSPLKIIGYRANRSYSVKLTDVSKLQSLVTTVLKNGANQLFDIDLRTKELRKYRDQARQMAVKAAKEKAVDLAGELACHVGKPRTITENAGYTDYGRTRGAFNNMAQMAAAAPGASDAGDSLPLGQISVRATVSVEFDLEPAN